MGNFKTMAAAATRLVLRGRIATLDGAATVHPSASVCILDDVIEAVAPAGQALPAAYAQATVIDTGGTIFPGLIDLHNHLSYNFLPLWSAPRRFANRNIWREHEPSYKYEVAWPYELIAKNVRDPDLPRSVARYVECRALFGGVTSTQGLSFSSTGGAGNFTGLVRNVEAPGDPAFPAADGRTMDFAAPEIAKTLVPALQQPRPFIYHLSEGTDGDARQRFLDLEYQPGQWAINKRLIAIHGVALSSADQGRMAAARGLVWSPLSNFLLYGQTAEVIAARDQGVSIALGCDWAPSGSKNPLGELKIASLVNNHLGRPFNAEQLVRMVTTTPAKLLGWEQQVGSIEAGKKADLLVLTGAGGDAYDQLIGASERDILAVLIGGRPRLGRVSLLRVDPARQEIVRIGGEDYALDLTEAGGGPLAGLSFDTAQAKLRDALAHLPELARQTVANHALIAEGALAKPLAIIGEYDDAKDRFGLLAAEQIDPTKLRPMALERATEIDDTDYRARLRRNINLPDFLRAAL